MKVIGAATAAGAVLAAGLAFGSGSAFAATTLDVHTPSDTSCGVGSPYTTIQSAVNAAKSGTTILVCPGTYQEEVTIPSGKNNLTLESTGKTPSTIEAPATYATTTEPIVDVDGALNTKIDRFTITGPFTGALNCSDDESGIRVEGGGSADILDNTITDISDSPISGCQDGVGIEVGEDNPPAQDFSGTATIEDNTIESFQKDGIAIDNAGSSGTVENNVVKGVGSTDVIAQNGIQVSNGATGTVTDNQVSANQYSPQTYGASGILAYAAGALSITNNVVNTSDYGIVAESDTGTQTISGNVVNGSTFTGITLQSLTSGTVTDNDASNGTDQGGAGGYTADGFDLYGVTGAKLTKNVALDNTGNGFYVDPTSSGNTLSSDYANGSGVNDCEDDSKGTGTAGTADTWTGDVGTTSDPAGICQAPKKSGSSPNVRTDVARRDSARAEAPRLRVQPAR